MRPARDAPRLHHQRSKPQPPQPKPTSSRRADAEIGRARAVDDAALRLVVQRNDELRAIVGLAVQRLVQMISEDRGDAVGAIRWSASCGRVMRSSPALATSPLSIVTAASAAPVGAHHGRKHMRADRLLGMRIVTGTSMVASNTSPPSGSRSCVFRRVELLRARLIKTETGSSASFASLAALTASAFLVSAASAATWATAAAANLDFALALAASAAYAVPRLSQRPSASGPRLVPWPGRSRRRRAPSLRPRARHRRQSWPIQACAAPP